MAKFLTGKELYDSIYNIIWDAKEKLIIVSPFIKLDEYFKKLFEKHKHNHKVQIIIIFGRNESAPSKSLRSVDFEFFKQFKNVTIIYCPKLHAKYYANESESVITSINLYDKCFEANIEFGIHYKMDLINSIISNPDKDSWNFTYDSIIDKFPVVYIKRPVYEKNLLSLVTGAKYIDSEVLYDKTDIIISSVRQWEKEEKKYYLDFPEELDNKAKGVRPERSKMVTEERTSATNNINSLSEKQYSVKQRPHTGYCIRTGVPIQYNPSRPLSKEAYQTWAQFENPDYPENFCHSSGKPSFGKTSVRKPILISP